MVATAVKATETLASLDAMPPYAGSQPPHLVDLRQRTPARMHRALDMLGLPYTNRLNG